MLALDLAKSFGKSAAFGIIGLWLFNIIGFLILAFGDATYQGPAALETAPAPVAQPMSENPPEPPAPQA